MPSLHIDRLSLFRDINGEKRGKKSLSKAALAYLAKGHKKTDDSRERLGLVLFGLEMPGQTNTNCIQHTVTLTVTVFLASPGSRQYSPGFLCVSMNIFLLAIPFRSFRNSQIHTSAQFGQLCVSESEVAAGILTVTARSPRHSIIDELDRKICDMELPLYALNLLPEGAASYAGKRSWYVFESNDTRGAAFLYVHRAFFAQGLNDFPLYPLRSTCTPSVF